VKNLFLISEEQLRGRPRQSAIALASVAVGAAMLIVTLSLTTGLSEDFLRKTTETSAHVEVLPRRPPAARAERMPAAGEQVFALERHALPDEKRAVRGVAGALAALRRIPGVRVATPAVEAQVVLLYGTVRRQAALQGAIPAEEARVTALDRKVVDGSWEALARTPDGVILGRALARSLGVETGAHLQAVGPAGGAIPLRVVGLVRSGLTRVDRTLALVNLPLAQALAGLSTDQATTLRIALDDPLAAPAVAHAAEDATGYVARSWQEKSAASVDAFDRQNKITLVLVLFTVLVAAFGVANVLVQLVADKRRDIAVLRAMGFSRFDVRAIYLMQGALLGLFGATIGWVVGAVLIRVIAALPIDFGEEAALQNQRLQMAEHPRFYAVALVLSVVVCMIAALGPANRAARLEPTAILRGER
jgi:lipoprotein-releasing system permease protein